LPRYGLPLTIPAAIVGGLFLHRRLAEGSGFRMVLWVLVAWGLTIGIGVLVWVLGPKTFPPHRLLVLALPIPLLAGVATIPLEKAASVRHPRLARGLPTLTIVVVALGSSVLWIRNHPWIDEGSLRSAANAAEFLDDRQVPASTPIIVICDAGGDALNTFDIMQDTFKMAVPPERVGSTYFYLGGVGSYEQGVPDLSGEEAHDAISLAHWENVARLRESPHVTLVLRDFSPSFDELEAAVPERTVLPGVVVLEGPLSDPSVDDSEGPVVLGPPILLPVFALITLLLLAFVGWGWSAVGFPTLSIRDRVAISPAVGVAALLVFGVALDESGVPLADWGGELAAAGATAIGFLLWLATPLRRRCGRS
jgi:hypothetical protein